MSYWDETEPGFSGEELAGFEEWGGDDLYVDGSTAEDVDDPGYDEAEESHDPADGYTDQELDEDLNVEHAMDFAGSLERHYDFINATVEAAIVQGFLGEDYTLPPVEDFFGGMEVIIALSIEPETEGWEPEVVFVPHGLSLEQWADLVGLDANDDRLVQLHAMAAEADADAQSKWSMVIMNGVNGTVPAEVVTALAPEEARSDPATVVRAVSPTFIEYLAAQWGRDVCEDVPLDVDTATLLQERLVIDGAEHVVTVETADGELLVRTTPLGQAPPDNAIIRPVARA